jgi:glycosyltransferase involved in cell wall biosynthesis
MVAGLKNQIGDFDRQFIFVDDGSTDNSLALLHQYTKDMTNVKIIQQKNQGPSVAVNTGIKAADLEYIKLLDGDDKLLPDASVTLIEVMKKTGCKVARGLFSNYYPQDINKQFSGDIQIISDSLKRALKFLPLQPSSCLLDAKLAKAIGGCDERVFIQDYSISLRLALHSNFVVVNKIVAHNIDKDQQRLSSNKLRENRDTALARYYFIFQA